jgi:predicted N-acetyltransferase YhbS
MITIRSEQPADVEGIHEYGVDDPFMALELSLGGLPKVPGIIKYVKVFSELLDG